MSHKPDIPGQDCLSVDAGSEPRTRAIGDCAGTPHSGILAGRADPRSKPAFAQAGNTDAAALPEVVYTPESELCHPLAMLRGLAADIRDGRELAWRLFVRNIRAQYRQTFLGFAWVLIPPLATTLLWVILQANKVVNFQSPANIPYALFVLTGTVLWSMFMTAVTAPIAAITSGQEMLGKLRFSREALFMTSAGHMLFNFVLQLLLLVPVFIYYRIPLSGTMLLFPVGVAGLMFLGLGIGFMLAPVGMLYKDIGSGISVLGRFWMYLTPVIYQPLSGRTGTIINWVNPAASVLTATRDWLLVGRTDFLPGFAIFGAVGVLLTIIGLLAIRLAMPILIERA